MKSALPRDRRQLVADLLVLLDLQSTGDLVHDIGDLELRLAWGKVCARLAYLRHDAPDASHERRER